MAAQNLVGTNWNAVEGFFEGNGWTPQQAQGITAGLAAESGLDPNAINDTSGASGIAQWLGSRVNSATSSGDLTQELQDVQSELTGSESAAGNAIRGQSSASGALSTFVNSFERPGAAGAAGDITRGTNALNSYSSGGGGSVTIGGTDEQWNANLLSASNQGVGDDAPTLTDSDFDGLQDSDVWSGASTVPGGGAFQGTPNLGGGVSMSATDPSSIAAATQGGGTPITITDLPGLDTSVKGAGTDVKSGLTTSGTDVENAAGGIVGTFTSAVNSLQTYASGALVVLGLIVMGLVFVGFGLGMFKHNIAAAV